MQAWPIYLKKKGKKIIIPLGPHDNEIEKTLKPLVPANTLFIKEPLAQLPLSLHGCERYIGNDTGIKHLCVALGIPTYTLFGPEPPTEWHPYDSEKHPYYYLSPLECRTKYAHYCDLRNCQSMICLNTLTVESLFKKIIDN